MNIKLKTHLQNWMDRKADEHDINLGRASMIRIKKKGVRREKPEKHYSLPLWKKCTTYLMLILTFQFIVPPHVIAQEIAEAQQRAIIEQNQRNFRTNVNRSLPIGTQSDQTIQIVQATCTRILQNLDAKKSIDSDLKDIEQLYKNLEDIRTKAIAQVDAQRARLEQKKAKPEALKRCDDMKARFQAHYDAFFLKVKAVKEVESNPEKLRAAIQNLNNYLEECRNKNKAPQSSQPASRGTEQKKHAISTLSSVPHNGILLASASDTIGNWLNGLDNLAITGAPSEADLAATPDIVIDDEIRALAEQLEKSPVKIYEYIRNNFVYEPYWAGQKGAKRTLAEKAGNDVDLASLMMALFRASGIHCRYVCGTIEMPIADAGRWIGVDDPAQIAKTFISNGIPCETSVSAGQISKIRLNHVWVKAYVDYFPYKGAVNEHPNTWVELDGSFKANTFTMKNDLEKTIGINPATLLTNVKAQSEVKPLYATKVPESFILSEIFSYGEPIRSYLAANSLTSENVFRQRKVNEEKYGLLPVTDLYDVVRGLSFSSLPVSLCGKVNFTLRNNDNSVAFTHEVSLASLANSRVTLGYIPASDIDSTNIQQNVDAVNFPVYLINLIPQFKIGDEVIGSGSAIGMGKKQYLEVTFNIPGLESQFNTAEIIAGSFSAFVLDYQTVTGDMLKAQMGKINALITSSSNSRDAVLGETLHGLGLSYFHQMDRFNQITAGNLGVAITRVPSMIRVSWDLKVADQLITTASVDRIKLDVIRDFCVPVAIKADNLAGEKQFAFTSALTGTALEHNVLTQPFNTEAASAARVIQQANNLQKPVYTVTAQNINEIIPLLTPTFPTAAINDIRNAVNANMEVTVPESAVPLNGQDYYAYVKRDIATNSSSFVLDTLAGGEMVNASLKASDLLLDGSSANYKLIMTPMVDWLKVAEDSTTNAGLAYLPAITALNNWYANRAELDPVTTIAAIIAVSGPITKVYNQPAILNVVTGDKLISPNGDGIKDSFTLKADVTKGATWKWQVTNPAGTVILSEEKTTPAVDIIFDQNVPDGTYSYRLTAVANGVNADPISGTFKVDCTKPTVAISQPDPSATVTDNKSLALRGTADDINFEKVIITAQGVGMTEPVKIYESSNITVENLLTTISSALYTNGALLITMTATDKAGNSNTVSKTYTLANPVPDNIAPTIQMAVTNPKDNSAVTAGSTVDAETGTLNIAITASDVMPEVTNPVPATKINLYLDGVVIASAATATELNHALATVTLRDGAHTLQSEAFDKAGNKAQSPLINFNLTSPISNFRVTPDLAKPGTSNISITANIRDALADGQKWVLSFDGPSQIPNIEGTTAAIAGNINPANYQDGKYTVTLTVNGKTPSLPFEIDMVKMAPVAKIANIAEGDIIREGLFNLVGTADDADPSDTVKYKLALIDKDGNSITVTPKPRDAQGYREGRIADASFGDLDFTMLKNNYYTLQLTVQSDDGIEQAEVEFALNSELKIGQMSFSQQDLVIPVNGQPISVIRTYNSMNTAYTGDFGPGWTYSIKDMEVEINEKRGFGQDEYGESFPMRIGGSRDVTVTMPDGKRLSFYYDVIQGGGYFPTYWAYWRPGPGNYASLVPTCSNEIVALPGGMQYWTASGPQTPMDQFDIPGFILTLKDGTKYLIEREHVGDYFLMGDDVTSGTTFIQSYGKASLKQITDNNGNRIVFNDDGIQSYNADGEKTKSIVFDRDAANGNRITAIYAPSSLNEDGTKPEGAIPQFKYEYDAQGNLVKVHKLIDRTKPVDQQYAVTEYLYENADRPHYVTAIKDALGNTPMKCIYDEDGRLIATEDANGNRIAMNHDLSGRTETITDRMGNPTIHSFDDMGNVTATIDAQGNTTKYSYDNLGNKLSETNALGYTTSYTYDSMGNQTSVTDALGNVTKYEYDSKGNQTKIVDALGNVTSKAYDSIGNITGITTPMGTRLGYQYDSNGNVISSSNGLGLKSNSSYDSSGNIVSSTSPAGVTTTFEFDLNGNQTNTIIQKSVDGISYTIQNKNVYNDAGLLTLDVDAYGNSKAYSYNALSKVDSVTDNYGFSANFVYDTKGNVIQRKTSDGLQTKCVYDKENRLVVSSDLGKEGDIVDGTRSIYDSVGRLIRKERLRNVVIEVVGRESQFIGCDGIISSTTNYYDAKGQLIKSQDAKGNIFSYEYDAVGNRIATTDPLGNKTKNKYDETGLLIETHDALGKVTQFEYNANRQRVKTINPDGTYEHIVYNTAGQIVQKSDELGKTSFFEYDDLGRLSVIIKPEVIDAKTGTLTNPRWEFKYHIYGNRISIIDPNGNETKFKYDHLNRCVKRILPMGQEENIKFNSQGQLIEQKDFKDQKVCYHYDTLGRLIREEYFHTEASSVAEYIDYTYDEFHRKKKITDVRGGITEFSYNSSGDIASIQSPEGTIYYEYDPVSEKVTRVRTAYNDIQYTFDECYRLKKVTLNKKNGADLSIPEVTFYEYNKNGVRNSMKLPNGAKTSYLYDERKRLIQVTNKDANDKTLSQFNYTLDGTGRVIALQEQCLSQEGSMTQANIQYQYDNLYRLVNEDRTGDNSFKATYLYDLNSNRLGKILNSNGVVESINYSYNNNDQLLVEESNINGITNYSYDANGSLLRKQNLAQEFDYQFGYNLQNRLATSDIQRKEGSNNVRIVGNYGYDFAGNRVRVSQSVNGITENRFFLLDSGHSGYEQIFEETNTVGGIPVRSYVIGNKIVSQTNRSSTYYFLYDGHGNTRQLLDTDSQIQESYGYDAYGQLLGGTPNSTDRSKLTEFLYTGEQFDSALQMMYLRMRYYAANTGTFNRLDPYIGDINDPLSLNKYGYAHADPINGIDPSGESLVSLLMNMTIQTFIFSSISSVAGGAIGRVATAILPDCLVSQILGPFAATSLGVGANLNLGAKFASAALGGQLMWYPDDGWYAYGYLQAGLQVANDVSGSLSLSFTASFFYADAMDHVGYSLVTSVPYRYLPLNIRKRLFYHVSQILLGNITDPITEARKLRRAGIIKGGGRQVKQFRREVLNKNYMEKIRSAGEKANKFLDTTVEKLNFSGGISMTSWDRGFFELGFTAASTKPNANSLSVSCAHTWYINMDEVLKTLFPEE